MSNYCTDKRIQSMLLAYELGQLSEEELREVGVHIIECDACYKEVKRLQAMSALLRDDPEARDCIDQVVKDYDTRAGAGSKPAAARSWRKLLGRLAIGVAAVVIILMLIPWEIQITPTDQAIAAQNRLLVMDFEGANEDDRMGEIAAALVITDLSESGFIQMVSRQRIHDVTRLLKQQGAAVEGRLTASALGRAAGARWMLTGQLFESEGEIILSTQLVEVSSGELVASQSVTGQDIFSMVDDLTIKVKQALPLPEAARDEPDRPVAEITTHSQSAYRHFLRGLVDYHRVYKAEAARSFLLALEEDSTYAMAYYYLSLISDARLIDRAVEFSANASRNDRYLIRSQAALVAGEYERAIDELQRLIARDPENKEAYFQTGICYSMLNDHEKSIGYYKEATVIDPLYKTAYNQLAYAYDWIGEFEKSIDAIDTYISIAPDEANPYDSRGDIYLSNGRLQAAIDSYREALRVKPDFWTTLFKLGRGYMLLGDFNKADSCYETLSACSNPYWRSEGRAGKAYVPLHEGRFADAIRTIDEGLAMIETDPEGQEILCFNHLKAVAYEELGEYDRAAVEIENSIEVYRRGNPVVGNYNKHLLIHLLATSGDLERAERIAGELGSNLRTAQDSLFFAFGSASLELSKGNTESATALLETATLDSASPYAPVLFMLGRVYLDAGRYEEALAVLERLYVNYEDNAIVYGSLKARAHYLIGRASEGLGEAELAIDHYGTFLDIWKDADSGLAEVEDARSRLTRLKNAS